MKGQKIYTGRGTAVLEASEHEVLRNQSGARKLITNRRAAQARARQAEKFQAVVCQMFAEILSSVCRTDNGYAVPDQEQMVWLPCPLPGTTEASLSSFTQMGLTFLSFWTKFPYEYIHAIRNQGLAILSSLDEQGKVTVRRSVPRNLAIKAQWAAIFEELITVIRFVMDGNGTVGFFYRESDVIKGGPHASDEKPDETA